MGTLGDRSTVPDLMAMLTDSQRDDCVRSSIKSLVAELLSLLAQRQTYNASEGKWMGIVQSIAQVADDSETVKTLLKMMPVKPTSEEEKHLAQVLYAALYSISRRVGIRVSQSGQIESLAAPYSLHIATRSSR